MHPDQGASIFNFMLRRQDAKQHLSTYIEKLFKEYPTSSALLTVLEKVVANYAQSLSERRSLSLKTKILFQTNSLKNGEHFLDESEIVDLVCKKIGEFVSESNYITKRAYLHILNVLFLELTTAECSIDQLTINLVKWQLKMGQINQLQQLFQYGFLKESIVLAIIFCELGSSKRIYHTLNLPEIDKEEWIVTEAEPENRRECLQIGLEFLRRVKHLFSKPDYMKVLALYLVENHRIAETLALIQSGELELGAIDVKKLLLNSKSKHSNYSFNNTMAFVNTQTGFRLYQYVSNQELEKIIKM